MTTNINGVNEEDYSNYSDDYKDLNGFRPRNWETVTPQMIADTRADYDVMLADLDAECDRHAEEAEYIDNMEKGWKSTSTVGNIGDLF
jgi:hypothetical protein